MKKFIDFTGQRFGRFTVLGEGPKRKRSLRSWRALCDCGKEFISPQENIRRGTVRSCGCLRDETAKKRMTSHGHSTDGKTSAEYRAYKNAKSRCLYTKRPTFKHYGGRGIVMCDRWLNDPQAFLTDMGPKPAGTTLERIDNDGPYSPENCEWRPWSDQIRNRRVTRKANDGRLFVEIAISNGITEAAYYNRVSRGWSDEDASTRPPRKR